MIERIMEGSKLGIPFVGLKSLISQQSEIESIRR